MTHDYTRYATPILWKQKPPPRYNGEGKYGACGDCKVLE